MNPAEGGHPTHLIKKNMALVTQDHLVSARAVREHTDQVSHGAAGDKDRGFFSNAFCGNFLQTIDRRVFTEDVVSHFRPGHGVPHGVGRGRQGVASEVDEVH